MEDNNDQVELITQADPTPDELVVKIKDYMNQTRQNIIEIGKLLIQAKSQVPHGEWAKWLADNIDFTQNTAHRFMRCAERFSNCAPAHNLNSTQMFELLALKQADTESFIATKSEEGTPVENMSKKTLRIAIKQWKLDHNSSTKNENTQSNNDNINANEIKKVEQFFNLVNQLADFQNIDSLIQKFKIDNSDKLETYSSNLKKLVNVISVADKQ